VLFSYVIDPSWTKEDLEQYENDQRCYRVEINMLPEAETLLDAKKKRVAQSSSDEERGEPPKKSPKIEGVLVGGTSSLLYI